MSDEAKILPLASGPLAIQWKNRAEYRLGKLDQPGTMQDMQAGGARLLSALCDFIWAAQYHGPADAKHKKRPLRPKFSAPEDIIEEITNDNIGEVTDILIACMTAALPDVKKKASPNGYGPESTSA